MFQIVISAFLSLMVVSCGGPRYVDYFPYHDDGTLKPKIALMPILDTSCNELPWDISEEISDGIYYELMNSGEFYVVAPREMGLGWAKRNEIDFFTNDYSYVGDFDHTDFIVAMEIIERSITPCNSCSLTSRECYPINQTMTTRIKIKIIDIRYCEPKIVLYEVFKTCYTAMPAKGYADGEICWRDPGYSKSFCGTAHQRLIQNLTNRLEEVIWSAR